MRDPYGEGLVGKRLRAVVEGYLRYYAVPTNYAAPVLLRSQVERLWQRALARRRQKHRVRWAQVRRPCHRWLPLAPPSVSVAPLGGGFRHWRTADASSFVS